MTNLKELHYDRFVHAEEFMLTEEEIKKLVYPDVTDDRFWLPDPVGDRRLLR